uniref:3-ketoacyl-CoA synthase 4-like n=1 Tax=Erigeron canadensis TaxID=72917 RepID=UPI001CB925EE|nr:3-ketoacyl-CoA synthase 4-like [Erigeron canadensis]
MAKLKDTEVVVLLVVTENDDSMLWWWVSTVVAAPYILTDECWPDKILDGNLGFELTRMMMDLVQKLNLQYLKQGYNYLINNIIVTLYLLPLFIVIIAFQASLLVFKYIENIYPLLECNLLVYMALLGTIVVGFTAYLMTRPRPIYLIDFSCYRPPDSLKAKLQIFMDQAKLHGGFDDSSLEFIGKILERSGLGDETYLPAVMHRSPPEPSMTAAIKEVEDEMFGALNNLFKTKKVNPKDIGILVINSSLFNPIPSLCSIIVNKYKLKEDIKTFSLGGMGCSAGVIAIDLAKDMLKVHQNTYAIVVSLENMVQEWYKGNKKSMLIPNCLFRIGCAAVLLSNKSWHKQHAKYKLLHVVRTHEGSDDTSYKCIHQEKDDAGKEGISLSKDLMTIAGHALKANITMLAPLVLPINEQLSFFVTLVARKIINSNIKPYVPDFKLAIDHFCIHAGGKAVIDELEKSLRLSKDHVEPSRMTLYRFGNTSSSSIWYELAFMEAKGRIKKGNRVWQIAFGSGFKCNSAVWEAIRAVEPSASNPWADC